MTESTTCPQCGSPLTPHAIHGICPRCLLQAGFESRPIPPAGATDQPTYVSSTPAAPQLEDVAALFPQLEILELLGRGGMGAVYKARQRDLHRTVALKILPPEMARDPSFGERFVREARALASLNHPHIVTIYDFGQAQGVYYLLMEYVDGVNLRQAQQAGHIAPEQVLGIISQICEALQYAHEEGVVHRDIKPENILLDRRGRLKIADFGLAKLVRNEPADLPLTQTQQVMGTLHYMAPEQIEHPTQVDHRADIYSLGVVFYELLTGELPLGRFESPSHMVQIDVRLDEIVLRALERNPERRYQFAGQVKTEVDTVTNTPAGRPIQTPSVQNPAPAGHAAVANRLKFPAIGLCCVGALSCVIPPALVLGVFLMSFGPRSHGGVGVGPLEVLLFCAHVPFGVLLVVGSLQMLRLNSYAWAMAAAILGLIPCSPAFFISLPLGIWALFVLSQDEIRAAFERRRRQQDAQPPSDRGEITWTGTGLVVSGAIQLLCGLIFGLIISWVVVSPNAVPSVAALAMFLLLGGLCVVCSALMIAGGVQMLGRGSWGLAKAGAIAALVPLGPWWLIGFPCGLCALLVLYRPGIRRLFRNSESHPESPSPSGEVPRPATGSAVAAVDRAAVPAKLIIPSVGLLCAAGVQVLFAVYLMVGALGGNPSAPSVRMAGLVAFPVVSLIACLLMIRGALQMLSPGSLGLARAGAIAGLLPFGPGWMIGFPSGIWALIVLYRPETRTLFGRRAARAGGPPQTPTAEDSRGGADGGPPSSGVSQYDSWSPGSPRSSFHPARLKLMAVLGTVAIVAAILLAVGPGWRAAVFDAAERGDGTRMQTLLAISHDVNIRDKSGETPLIKAARRGHVMVIRALTNIAPVDEPDQHGMTALMHAAIEGKTGAVEALMDANAKIDAVAAAGETALALAAYNGQWDTIVSLLQRGANPAIQDRKGKTALMLAAAGGHVSAVDILLRDTNWPLRDPGFGKLSREAIVNLRDHEGNTALMLAVRAHHNAEIVRRLLEAHADPQLGRPDRTMPLFEAVQIGDLAVIEQLLQAKADPNQVRTDGESPLSMAVVFGNDNVINALLKAGATLVPSLDLRWAYRLAQKGNFKEAQPLFEKLLSEFPAETRASRFGIEGWTYEVPDTRRLLQLLLAECCTRTDEKQRVPELLGQVLDSWTKDNYPVEIYRRKSTMPGTEVEESYGLRRAPLEGWRGTGVLPEVSLSGFRRENRPGRQTETRGLSELQGIVH